MKQMADTDSSTEEISLQGGLGHSLPENFEIERLSNAILCIQLEIFATKKSIWEKVKTPRILKDYQQVMTFFICFPIVLVCKMKTLHHTVHHTKNCVFSKLLFTCYISQIVACSKIKVHVASFLFDGQHFVRTLKLISFLIVSYLFCSTYCGKVAR